MQDAFLGCNSDNNWYEPGTVLMVKPIHNLKLTMKTIFYTIDHRCIPNVFIIVPLSSDHYFRLTFSIRE